MLVYYSTLIFARMGYSSFLSSLLAAVMNTLCAVGTFALPPTIERIGRRPILIWTAVGCTGSMLIFVTMINLPVQTVATGWVAVAFVIMYNFFFGFGWAGVPWLYGVEVSIPYLPHKQVISSYIIDCSFNLSSCWWGCWCLWSVDRLLHNGVCWRDRT